MLKSILKSSGQPVIADEAVKGENYICPECKANLIVKQGSIVCWHFAHHSESRCEYGTGESMEHEAAKLHFYRTLKKSGRWAEVDIERTIKTPLGIRRADVFARANSGQQFVFEIQCSPISQYDFSIRTKSYKSAGIRCIWLPHGNRLDHLFQSCWWHQDQWKLKGVHSIGYSIEIIRRGEKIKADIHDMPFWVNSMETDTSRANRLVRPKPKPKKYHSKWCDNCGKWISVI